MGGARVAFIEAGAVHFVDQAAGYRAADQAAGHQAERGRRHA